MCQHFKHLHWQALVRASCKWTATMVDVRVVVWIRDASFWGHTLRGGVGGGGFCCMGTSKISGGIINTFCKFGPRCCLGHARDLLKTLLAPPPCLGCESGPSADSSSRSCCAWLAHLLCVCMSQMSGFTFPFNKVTVEHLIKSGK